MADANDAIRTIRRIVRDVVNDDRKNTSTKMARVHAVAPRGARVIFDGESSPTTKHYRYLKNSGIQVGERVILHRVGDSWVIMGSLSV